MAETEVLKMYRFIRKVLLLSTIFTIMFICILHVKWAYAVSEPSAKAKVKIASTETKKVNYKKKYKVASRSGSSLSTFKNVGNVIDYACKYIGARYKYGAAGPAAFDCSGFIMFVMGNYGISLPHSVYSQKDYGKTVSRGDLMPGDLVYFTTSGNGKISHVGIYIGDGNFIHASLKGVMISNLSQRYYSSRYVTAKRIIN